MAIFNKTVHLPPQLISYEDTRYYLQINPSGCVLYHENSFVPLFQLHEPLLLIQGLAANNRQVHLVMLKANGDLCYTLINSSEQNQTTVLAKLDVRTTRYRRLLLFPLGKTIHIFYAYAHQAIPDLWRIEHRFWNGKTWRSVNLGEVVHPREPLYDIVLDRGGNLHLLMMTFQGRQTVILTNRFNGSFYLWGNTSQTFQIPQEVIDITSIITPDNIHHLFWLAKTPSAKFELGWAYQANVQDLTGNWLKSPAALQTLNGPVKGLGVIEVNGSLWLLVNAEVETLLFYKGDGWKQVLSNTPTHRQLRYVRKNNSSYYNTYWLEENRDSRTPAYHQYLGLNFNTISAQVNQSPFIPPISSVPAPAQNPVYSQTPAYAQTSTNISPYKYQSAARTLTQPDPPRNPQPLDQSAYNTVQSPIAMSISNSPLISQPPQDKIPSSIPSEKAGQAPQTQLDLPETRIDNNLPQVESDNQSQVDTNLEFAYNNYPDEIIPPASEISSLTKPSYLPAYIDQPVFAAQPAAAEQPEQLATEINPAEPAGEDITETLTPAEPIPENSILDGSIPEDSTTLADSLPVFAPAKVSLPDPNLILLDTAENLKQILSPLITDTLDPFLKTIAELESQVTKIQDENDLTCKKFEQLRSELQLERETALEKIDNYLNLVDSQKENILREFEQQFSELKLERETTLEKIDNYLNLVDSQKENTLHKFEEQLSELKLEHQATLEKIDDYLNQVDSQKENTLQKFEQQLAELQQEEKTNQQKIEQLISSFQLQKEEAQKQKKGFWARWFK